MAYVSRSQYELGDPAFDAIAREEHTDHHRARARGQRILLLADSLVSRLDADSLITDGTVARRVVFHELAAALYGNNAIDVPDFTDERSLDTLRQGRAEP